MTIGIVFATLGAAAAIVFGGIGSIVGTMYAAKSGAGVVAEKPKAFGAALLTSALPSSQGIYGFLASIIILQKIGMISGNIVGIDLNVGLAIAFGALPVAFLGLVSGVAQGKVIQAGSRIMANNPSDVGKAVILAVLVESMAVFGLLLSILVINSIQV
jgi:V/A-type H+/Na+-transporting ATPase subunit K